MKTIKTIVLSICILFGTGQAFSQKGNGKGHGKGQGKEHGSGHHKHGDNKVIVKNNHGHPNGKVKSVYRPSKMVAFHPHWHPARSYNRRWVYFPRYNFYWDNWRQGYYYMKGSGIWVFKSTPPPVVINVNLEKEENYELKEDEDDDDNIYKTNDGHKSEFKPD